MAIHTSADGIRHRDIMVDGEPDTEELPRIPGWPSFAPAPQFVNDAADCELRRGDWYAVVLPGSASIRRSDGAYRVYTGKPFTLNDVRQGGRAYLCTRADPTEDA